MRPIEQLVEGGGSLESRDVSKRLLTREREDQGRFIEDLEDALTAADYSRVTELMSSLESPTSRCLTTPEHQVVELRVLRSSRASNR